MSDGINEFRKQLTAGLEKKRWSAKSITAAILFGAIIVVFALFGFPSHKTGEGTGGSAAQVNHTLISVAELRSESQRLEQMYAPLFGGQGIGDAQRQFVRQQALENLIVQELSSQMAQKAGILSTDKEIQDIIVREIPVFQENGRFQRDLYYRLLEANRLTPAEFESKLRKERVNLRTQRLFEAASVPSQAELQKLKHLQETKLNVAFARLDKDRVLQNAKYSPTEIQSRLSNTDFARKVQDYYNNNKAEFTVEPQVRAQHILIKTDADQAKAKAQIEDLKKRAKTEDFSKLAREFSQDEGSKAKGGDLGFFGKGRMVPEFETAAFNQKVGEVGDVIRSNFGYHLIKVTEKKDGGEKPFDTVRTEIAQKLMATEAYDAQMAALEEALGKGDTATVDASLKKLGVSWEETGLFDLNVDMVPKLASNEASRAAFELNQSKALYPKLVRDGSEKFVLKLKDFKTESLPGTADLQQTLMRERSSDLFRSWIENSKKTASIERNQQILQNGR